MKSKIKSVDICCGLSYGDEAKGKIIAYLSKTKDYDFVCRWNGGHNAGHTIYKNGVKYKTHLIPTGIFYDIKSVIGPNCIINKNKFISEIEYLREAGFNTSLIKIDPNCHVITDKHFEDEAANYSKDKSTSTGVAPCYGDKYARKGIQVKDIPFFTPYLLTEPLYGNILCEGAQGFWLDINQGNYPYTTSSHTLPYDACSIGFSPKLIKNIYGACKIYDTRSGVDPDFPNELFDDEELKLLAEIGKEYGVTTGRKRNVNWLNLDKLVKAINISGTNIIYVSKIDVIMKVGIYKLYHNGELQQFSNIEQMQNYINNVLTECCEIENIYYSGDVENIYLD